MSYSHVVSALVVVMTLMAASSAGGELPRPDPKNSALFARWLLNRSSWGVLATLDVGTKSPFGNIQSVTDAGTGSPYVYQLKDRERTGINAVNDSRASFTVTEYVLDFCGDLDPQSPKCGKLTLSGKLKLLPKNSTEANFGEAALFKTHPTFKGFPKQMNFDVFKLIVEEIFLVNMAAPPANISVAEYFSIKLQ